MPSLSDWFIVIRLYNVHIHLYVKKHNTQVAPEAIITTSTLHTTQEILSLTQEVKVL